MIVDGQKYIIQNSSLDLMCVSRYDKYARNHLIFLTKYFTEYQGRFTFSKEKKNCWWSKIGFGFFFWSFWNWTNKTHYNSSCKDKPLYIKYRNLFIRSHIFLHSVVEYRFFWQYLTTHYNKNKSLKEKTKKKLYQIE